MKRVALMGYYGFNNTGDEAILKALVDNLKEENIEVSVLTSDIEGTSKKLDVRCYDRKGDIFKALDYSDALVYGGGSIFQDATSSKSLYYYLAIILFAFLKRKHVYIYSHGIGPIDSKFNRFIFKQMMKLVSFISVRDKKSYDELLDLGINGEKIELISDSVFTLNPCDAARIEDILKNEEIIINEEKKTIGVSVRKCLRGSKYFVEEFSKICDNLIDECGFNLVFIPFQSPDDSVFSEEIISKMKNKNKVKILRDDYLPNEIMGVMSKMYMNIGVRLHSLIFSAKVGIPFIGIDYDVKISGFLRDLGFEKPQKYGKIKWDVLRQDVENIFNNYEVIQENLINKSKYNEKLAKENLKKITKMI